MATAKRREALTTAALAYAHSARRIRAHPPLWPVDRAYPVPLGLWHAAAAAKLCAARRGTRRSWNGRAHWLRQPRRHNGAPTRSGCTLGQGEITVLAITPDGTSILVGTHIGIMRYDAHTTQLSPLLPTGARVERLAISADGATFASAQLDGSIIIWSLADGSRLHVLDARAPRRGLIELLTEPSFFQRIESLAFSPDGTLLASDSGNGQIRLWDVTSGELLARLGEGDRRTSSLAFSPDGALLAAGGGWQSGRGNKGDLAVWDVAQRRLRFSLEGHTNVVQGLDFSADGTELASADEDGGIRRWRMTDGTLIEERPLEAQVTLLTGGWYLAEDGDGTPWSSQLPTPDRPFRSTAPRRGATARLSQRRAQLWPSLAMMTCWHAGIYQPAPRSVAGNFLNMG